MELPRNIKTLTGVRGYAALWVVFFHLKTNAYFLSLWTPGEFIRHGFWGVDVFFVLSGFVLSHVYESKFSGKVELKEYVHYLGLRLARMYPLHVVTFAAFILLFILSRFMGSGMIGSGVATQANGAVYDAVINLALLHAWGLTAHESFNTVSWSISAEWFAYLFLLVPCVRLLRKLPLKYLYLLVGIVWCMLIFVYVPMTPSKVVNMTHNFGILRIIPEFIGGYVAYRTVRAIRCNLPLFDLLCAVGLAGIVGVTFSIKFQVFLLPVCMLFIIGLSGEGPIAYRVFGNRTSLFLGEISYSIYMCHFMLLWVVDGICKRMYLDQTPWVGFGVVTAYIALVIFISYVLYAFVERPCRRWGRKVLDHMFPSCDNRDYVPRGLPAGLQTASTPLKDL